MAFMQSVKPQIAGITSTGGRRNIDLLELKLQKRMIREKLSSNKDEIWRISEALKAKDAARKLKEGNVSAAEATLTLGGTYCVDDFRLPAHQRKYTKAAPPAYSHENIEPCPITNIQLLRIRQENVQKTVCKREISRAIKAKEEREAERAYKESRKVRTLPKLKVPASMLPSRYERGELPCTIEHGLTGHYLSWAAPLDNLDYDYYLPIFFDGLQCKENPARFLARQGIEDLLYSSRGYPDRIISCIKNLVRPIRNALSKFDTDILLGVLKAIQLLVTSNEGIGATLMPYSKQFLAPIASFLDMNKNLGDGIDYGQRKDDDVGENVRRTLELMEEKGGPGAFEAIKFSIPLYQSCMRSLMLTKH